MVPFEKLVIEVDGLRHRWVKRTQDGETCTKCSLRDICKYFHYKDDKFCHLNNDYFVKD